MPANEYSLNSTANGAHGGAREGAGRKPAGFQKSKEQVDFETARARTETAKADKLELEFKIMTGEFISRSSVQQASATAYAALAQTMRSITDNLERKGVPLDVCRKVEEVLDEAMEDHANQMQLMSGAPAGETE